MKLSLTIRIKNDTIIHFRSKVEETILVHNNKNIQICRFGIYSCDKGKLLVEYNVEFVKN